MKFWPTRPRQQHSSDSEWVLHTTDDDLNVLMALLDADAPATPETLALSRRIKARALSALRRSRRLPSPSSVPAVPPDLPVRDWLRIRWATADAAARHTLRTLADALSVNLPLVRTRQDTGGKEAADSPNTLALVHTRSRPIEPILHAKPAQKATTDADSDDSRENDWIDDESAWTPCTSLYDALHPDERGWG